jgi:hypothetical protein
VGGALEDERRRRGHGDRVEGFNVLADIPGVEHGARTRWSWSPRTSILLGQPPLTMGGVVIAIEAMGILVQPKARWVTREAWPAPREPWRLLS